MQKQTQFISTLFAIIAALLFVVSAQISAYGALQAKYDAAVQSHHESLNMVQTLFNAENEYAAVYGYIVGKAEVYSGQAWGAGLDCLTSGENAEVCAIEWADKLGEFGFWLEFYLIEHDYENALIFLSDHVIG